MKKIFKRIITLFVVFAMVLSFVACNGETSSDDSSVNTETYETPNAGKDTVLYNKQTSKYDSEADTMRQGIIDAADSELTGLFGTYYVSYKGNDDNDGTTPETAWKTIDKVNSMNMMLSSSVVLFERGGVYRGNLQVISNCSYGAYGTGPKPCIYGSKRNYADESIWTKSTEYEGAWETTIVDNGLDSMSVGHIVFDHGVKVATKILSTDTNPKEYEYYCKGGKVYLFISDNPAKLYDSIEMGDNKNIISGESVKFIVIENLCIKYGGLHGMSFRGENNNPCEDIVIRNCEVGYIGGCASTPPLGNGIEFWLSTKNVTVENCWVYECFDAGITNQGRDVTHVQEGITYKNNLIEYCTYGIEYFAKGHQEGSVIRDTLYTGNLIRFSGYGWCDPATRYNETWQIGGIAPINGWGSNWFVGKFDATNFVIENNIFDTSWKYIINAYKPNQENRVVIRNNTYYQKKVGTACVWYDANENKVVSAEIEEQFKEEIAKIDTSPKEVVFELAN